MYGGGVREFGNRAAGGQIHSPIGQPTAYGTFDYAVTKAGPAAKFNGTNTYVEYAAANIPTVEFTLLWGGVFDANDSPRGFVDCTNNGVSGWNIYQGGGDTMYFNNSSYPAGNPSTGWTPGQFFHGALRNKGGVSADWFRNGAKVASGVGVSPAAPTLPLWIGRLKVGALPYLKARFSYLYLFDKYLGGETIARIAANPYVIFAPQRKLYLVGAPSSGVTGAVNYTNADDTSSGSGTTTVIGSIARTSGNDTLSAVGTTTIKGSLAKTNANDTSAASGTTTVTGALAVTNAGDTVSASGSVGSSVSGSVNYTNADDTSAASGTTTVTGSVAKANADDTAAAAGTTTVVGSIARSNANDTSAASGTTTVVGSLTKTNANDSCSASGTVTTGATGTVAVTNVDDSISAFGTTTIKGSLARTNRNDLVAASGIVNNGIVFEDALTGVKATSSGIKKPGIPATAPDWLRTSLEIIEGRRGNAIEIPLAQDLSFSSTPTKAECEALYQYTNTIRDAVEKVLNRLDG
jgi:hypothetical protein